MNNDAERGGIGRLWSGGAQARAPRPEEKVLPLKPEPWQAPAPGPLDERAYVAHEVRERAERLHIMRAAGPSRFPSYGYLLDISFDHHLQSAFTLVYTFMLVEVTGRNLAPVVHAISFGTCERIREFHPKLYDPPGISEPLIQAIAITAADERH